MMAAWRKWPLGFRFLSAWFALSAAFWAFVFLAHFFGFEVFPASTGPLAPPFSRSECLERKMHELYGDGIVASDLSDRAQSVIAAACAREEFGD